MPCFTERTGPFCDDNPSNNPSPTAKHRDHNAHNILPLTIYRHKMKNANPKKNLRAKTLFLQKSCAQETEDKVSPFFGWFLQWKSPSTIFGGSDLEIKPLEYINRRFYKFQFIIRTKLKLEPTKLDFTRQIFTAR